MAGLRKLWATLRGQRLEDDLDDELAFHIAQRTDDLIASGMPPEEARRQAQRVFGNRTGIRESVRDRDILVWLDSALQDLRFAGRALRRNPGFTVTAILSLALGIGANTALFSMLDTLLLRLLPVHDPNRLVRMSIENGASVNDSLPYPLLERMRQEGSCFSGVFGMSTLAEQIEEQGRTFPARVDVVTGEFFDVLGLTAARGRTFHLADSSFEMTGVAVISDSFWRSHYAGQDDAIGRRLRVRDREYTIAGVTEPGFRGTRIDAPADVWVPVEQAVAPQANQRKRLSWGWLVLFGRLAPGVTEAAAKAQSDAILRRHYEVLAGTMRFDHPQQREALFARRILMRPGANGISALRDLYSKPLLVIACIAVMVLLIACANLANLLLARATAREREISVRQALGAARPRLIRQLLVESLLLSFLGAGAALFAAYWLTKGMLRFLPHDLASALPVLAFHLDLRVLGFTAILAVLTCLLFGLAPALRATRSPASRISSQGMSQSVSQTWTSRGLVAAEIALCTLLLTTCGLFVRTLRNLRTLDAGFAREQILVTTILAPRGTAAAQAAARFDELRARVAALPEVRGVGYSQFGLMIGDRITSDVDVEGRVPAPGEDLGATDLRISPGYLSAMSTPLLAGRDFTDRDAFGAPLVAIVNEAFARKFFGGANPIGKHFGLDGPKSAGSIEIVGMVRDVKYQNLREPSASIYYRPFAQVRLDSGMVLAVRSTGNMSAVAASLSSLAQSAEFNFTARPPRLFSDFIDRTLLAERMVASFSTALGLLALLVACVGLYGVLAYRVARRTREIGVRMALGASTGVVLRMVLGESLAILLLGLVLGVPLSLGLTRLIGSLLFGLKPHDVTTLVATAAILAVASFSAACLPARRAARVDPMTALRCD